MREAGPRYSIPSYLSSPPQRTVPAPVDDWPCEDAALCIMGSSTLFCSVMRWLLHACGETAGAHRDLSVSQARVSFNAEGIEYVVGTVCTVCTTAGIEARKEAELCA
jgi:hypothetical protein